MADWERSRYDDRERRKSPTTEAGTEIGSQKRAQQTPSGNIGATLEELSTSLQCSFADHSQSVELAGGMHQLRHVRFTPSALL